jgi:proteasome activator subunit 4
VQKLVNSVAHDCLAHLNEEAMHTDAYVLDTPRIDEALVALEPEFSNRLVSKSLLKEAMSKSEVRVAKRSMAYDQTVSRSHTCLPRFFLTLPVDLIYPRSRVQAFNAC